VEVFYDMLRFYHVLSFVFMCVLLFNLIVASDRALRGISFSYDADRNVESLINKGVNWCYLFQVTILITGLLLLIFGDIGIQALWTDWVVLTKTIILFVLMATILNVHFNLQPKIESFYKVVTNGSDIPDSLLLKLERYVTLRKWMTAFYLFLVITAIVFGIQVRTTFHPILTIILVATAGLFSLTVDKILIRFGWI
jgi:hypothetical protein